MAEYIAPAQIVTAGANVIFGSGRGCCKIRHRDDTGIFTLKGSGNCNPARYRVDFHIVTTATAAAPIQLVITEDGEPMPETTVAIVPAAIGDIISSQTSTEVVVDCDCAKVAVRALSAVPLTAGNIIISRIA